MYLQFLHVDGFQLEGPQIRTTAIRHDGALQATRNIRRKTVSDPTGGSLTPQRGVLYSIRLRCGSRVATRALRLRSTDHGESPHLM